MSAVKQRIKLLVDAAGGRMPAAQMAGLSVDQLDRYVTGRSKPNFFALGALASASGVRLDWIWSGEGPMREDAPRAEDWDRQNPPLESPLFKAVHEAMARDLEVAGIRLSVESQSTLLLILYRMAHSLGRPLDPVFLQDLLLVFRPAPEHESRAEEKPDG